MKKLFVVAGLAGLVSSGLVAPAYAADPTDPAPTNVQISWKDETFQFVHVTWDEDTPQPNRVIVRKAGTTGHGLIKAMAADAPNAIDLPKRDVLLVGSKLEVGVSVGDAAGETSPVGLSVPFDTIDAGAPLIQSYQPSGSGTLQVTWKPGTPIFKDTTPGDPLDRNLPASYQPAYRGANGVPVPVGPPTANTTTTFTGPKPPYEFVVTALNEWTGVSSEAVYARPIGFTTSIPTWVIAGTNTVIRGTYTGPDSATVTLQARNTPTSAWYAVNGYAFTNHTYQFTMPSRGTRQYRVVVSNSKDPFSKTGWFGGYSGVVTTTTQQKVTMALAKPTVVRGYSSWGTLSVNPPVEGFADLQRWNGKTWVHVKNNAIIHGIAYFDMNCWTVGTFTYRYYSAERVYNGLLVAAAYSPNFTVKVIP